jgi:hypothetical protein
MSCRARKSSRVGIFELGIEAFDSKELVLHGRNVLIEHVVGYFFLFVIFFVLLDKKVDIGFEVIELHQEHVKEGLFFVLHRTLLCRRRAAWNG